jgi:hypothetical protein
MVEPFEPQLRQARQLALLARLADGEHDRHRLGQQPARHESDHLHGGAVEPLEIVHETQQRLRLGHLRQETERRQAHEEAVRSSAGREAERDPQGVLLRLRERSEATEQRHAELMQTRERQLHLRLDAGDLDDPETRSLTGGETQQRRLAHARLAADGEHAAAAPRAASRSRSRSLDRPRNAGGRWSAAMVRTRYPGDRPGTSPGATSAGSRDRVAIKPNPRRPT